MNKSWTVAVDDDCWLVTRIVRLPGEFRFSVMYILDTGKKWIEPVRIDNYPHFGEKKTHIHRKGDSRVEFREMSLKEAEETAQRIGKNIRERIKNGSHTDY